MTMTSSEPASSGPDGIGNNRQVLIPRWMLSFLGGIVFMLVWGAFITAAFIGVWLFVIFSNVNDTRQQLEKKMPVIEKKIEAVDKNVKQLQKDSNHQ